MQFDSNRQFRRIPLREPRKPIISPVLILLVMGFAIFVASSAYAYQVYSSKVTKQVRGQVNFCSVDDLSFKAKYLGGATGSVIFSIKYTNISAADCIVQGYPSVTLLTNGGKPVAAQSYDLPSEARVLNIKPDTSVQSFVIWGNWCSGDSGVLPIKAAVKMPSMLEEMKVGISDINGDQYFVLPSCANKTGKSSIAIGPFVTQDELTLTN